MRKKLSWHFYLVCGFIAIITAGLFAHFSYEEERAFELADLRMMKSAEVAAALLWHDNLPEEPVEYWFQPWTMQLIPISEPMPASYGAGTRRNGRAVKVFEDQTGTSYAYSGREDYTDKILHLVVNNIDGDLHISMDWVSNR